MSAPSFDDVLKVAKEAALLAGATIAEAWSTTANAAVASKSASIDLVTATDQKCEELIIGKVKEHFPDHLFIGEEGVGTGGYQLTDAPTWIIDPIDGTTNFVHGFPCSVVSIGWAFGSHAKVGVVYNPIIGEMFWGVRGQGSFMESKHQSGKLSVSNTTTLDKAIVATEVGYDRTPEGIERMSSNIAKLLGCNLQALRCTGSAAMNMTSVACGRFDAYFEEGPKIWDFAGSQVILEEAGGVTLDPSGGEFDIMKKRVLAVCNRELGGKIASTISL